MTPRWIGYSDVYGKYCSISRNTYLVMAREGTWGPTATIRGMVMVSEAAVKRWAETPGKTTRELVRKRIEVQDARPDLQTRSGEAGHSNSRARRVDTAAVANDMP